MIFTRTLIRRRRIGRLGDIYLGKEEVENHGETNGKDEGSCMGIATRETCALARFLGNEINH